MTAHPRPTRADYEQALDRIHARRRAAGDDHPLALSEDPREVLAYLRRRGRGGLVADDTGDDVVDALTLREWLRDEGDEIELWLLEAAEATGRNRKTIGRPLGLKVGQAVVDRITRLRARLRNTADATEPAAAPAAPAPADDGRIRELAAALLRLRAQMPAEVADGLEVDTLTDALPRWTPGTPPPSEGVLNAVRFLLGDLVDVVPPGTDLRTVVDHGVELVGTRAVPGG